MSVKLPIPNAVSASLSETLRQRRQRLAERVDFPVLLWAGRAPARNFPANRFPFRASSHFLYFAGLPLENAVIHLEAGKLTLFMDEESADAALWHGEKPKRAEIADRIGANMALPLEELPARAKGAATLAIQSPIVYQQQCEILARPVVAASLSDGIDRQLAQAVVALRLVHDEAALMELRQAAAATVAAHKAGMATTSAVRSEAEVRASMERELLARDMTCAYSSIVTIHGEVLHNDVYSHSIQPGDLLLADVGAETASGWAADVTRTWPVSGKFSATQRDLYEVVLAAHDACIEQARPGVEYRDLHFLACRAIATGLVDLGILKGNPDSLVEQDAHALFFPHGVGHLLGLDVHDMEDLGDLAGYAKGRSRSDRFGLSFLRLDRPLKAGMLVTIEPGFYQVPAILNDPARRDRYRHAVNWERLAEFGDVRGIRIEDDISIAADGHAVLTQDLPADVDAIEQLISVS